jgi:hypothetical protein
MAITKWLIWLRKKARVICPQSVAPTSSIAATYGLADLKSVAASSETAAAMSWRREGHIQAVARAAAGPAQSHGRRAIAVPLRLYPTAPSPPSPRLQARPRVPRSPSLDNASSLKNSHQPPFGPRQPDLCVHVAERAVSMSIIDRGALDALCTRPYCASAKKRDLLVKSLCELVHKRIGTPRR